MKFDLNHRLAIFQMNVRALPALDIPEEVRQAASNYGFNLKKETENENSDKNKHSNVGRSVLRHSHANK